MCFRKTKAYRIWRLCRKKAGARAGPDGNPDRAGRLNNLSIYLSTRYKREGRLEDLTQAIKYSQKAVDLTPDGNPNRATLLNNLSNRLSTRYKREEKLEDLTQIIKYSQETVDLTSDNNPDRAGRLNNLSNRLSTRYEREGKLEDLIQTIKYSQEVVDLTPNTNPDRAALLNNLSNHLSTRYEREGKVEDLTQAIKYSQKTVDLISNINPDRAGRLNNLSIYLSIRYEREEKLEDLTQAIKYSQEIIDLTSNDNPNRAGRLNNLSNRLSIRYERENKLEDLIQAIKYSQKIVDLTSNGNPDRASRLNNLSNRLSTRYKRENKLEDLTQAIEHSRDASSCLSSPPLLRLRGCLNAIDFLAQSQRWREAQEIVECGLKILPSLISNLSSKLDQGEMMKSVSGIAALGCAVSLQCNNDGYSAIRILELSRGAINRLTINSRADLSLLHHSYPDLAKRFEDLRFLIGSPTGDREHVGEVTSSRESTVRELGELISKIRTKKGFEDFQTLPSKEELLEPSLDQSTVLLNTTHFRTDALLIHSNKRIQVLPLDQSIYQHSKYYYSQIHDRFGWGDNNDSAWNKANADMQSFLEWLWDEVVGPVLRAFNFESLGVLSEYNLPDSLIKAAQLTLQRHGDRSQDSNPDKLSIYQDLMEQHPNIVSSARPSKARSRAQADTTDPNFPRVHWIGIGHMAAFPFHAAGYGSCNPPKNTMSCVISSYASSLSARAYAKQKPVALESRSSTLLLVAMPRTPSQSPLPGVEREATSIQHTVQGSIAVKLRKLPPVKTILDDLPLYSSVHFACHGYSDPRSPFRSGLLLCGNEPEKDFQENTRESILTVETISSINTERSQLAFLSACCTAENASLVLMDEGIHLAGGFQLAGYPHVIASLWEANDDLSVEIAKKFYRIVFAESEIVGHERIAYALHDATLAARRISNDPLAWATTIHFGP